ncbi:hypothetical protein [Qingrenia yutianensis]
MSKVYMCVDRDDAGDKTVKRIGMFLNGNIRSTQIFLKNRV